MKITNEVTLKFMAISQNESFARSAVACFISRLPITVEELSDIKTAVSEAVTNCIVHGYNGTIGGFCEMECRLFTAEKKHVIEIAISDNGCGIEDIEQARQPLWTTQPEQERSGMGFTVMETFMDEVSVFSKKNGGTRVVLRKAING